MAWAKVTVLERTRQGLTQQPHPTLFSPTPHLEMTTHVVDLWDCVEGATNEAWLLTNNTLLVNADSGMCLTASPTSDPSICVNIWARPLSTGATALGFISNFAEPTNITCDTACFAKANVTASAVRIRDIVGHVDLGVFTKPLAVTVLVGGGGGDGSALLVSPI